MDGLVSVLVATVFCVYFTSFEFFKIRFKNQIFFCMKCYLFISFFLIGSNISAQILKTSQDQDIVYIASGDVQKRFIPAPDTSDFLKSGKVSKAQINVEFVNFQEEAKIAFLYAVSIWENTISSSVPINIIAHWESMDNMVLAKTRPAYIYRSFKGAPIKNVYYPIALVEKITGEETDVSVPDIICTFNANMPWYFKTDGDTPETKYDLTTVVLHEIAHGLGFFGFMKDKDGLGFIHNENSVPSIYDYFIFNELNQQISNNELFASPSEELHNQLISGKLKFYNIANNSSEIDRTIDWIYAPRVCKEGVSIYHLDEIGSECRLMGPFTYRGEAIHCIDESTLKILSAIGWNAVSFDFLAPKDFDSPCDELSVDIAVDCIFPDTTNYLQLIYSTNSFLTANAIEMHFNKSSQRFEGEIPLNYFTGNLQYYFKLNTIDSLTHFWPLSAPDSTFSLHIGSDYSSLKIMHNPVKLIYPSTSYLNLLATVKGDAEVKDVKVEYRLNGVTQENLILSNDSGEYYSGHLFFDKQLLASSKLEYRIVACDKLEKSKIIAVPATGFYTVNVFEPYQPVSAYHTDFDGGQEDFVMTDFIVSEQQGFTTNLLNTCHPYLASANENELYNHIAQLKYPIILKKNAEMSFDEVVLIEPDENGTKSSNSLFSDFAIVEGSNDNGKTWQPLTERYDAHLEEVWIDGYLKSLSAGNLYNYAQQNMFKKHTVSLTKNSNFIKGDTILIRFRLASNQMSTGWGWAIDNLEIQNNVTGSDIMVLNDVNVYPNPCRNQINIDFSVLPQTSFVTIHIIDLVGKTVYLDNNFQPTRKSIDLSKANPGIYLVTITDKNSNRLTKRIVKL